MLKFDILTNNIYFCSIINLKIAKMHSVIVLLKRIFTIQTIGLMVAVGSLLVAIHQVLSDSSGEPVVSWNGGEMTTGFAVTTYVYTSDSEPIPIAPLLATIENPTQYTAHDVSAKYRARVQGLSLQYSFDYKTQMGMQGIDIRNVESSLPAFEQMSSPINYAEMAGQQGELNLSLRLTYNGIETPFQASQRVVIKRFKSALYDNAVKDARKCAMGADDAIYVYMPQNGFMPLSIPAEVPQATKQTAETKGKSQSVQSKPHQQSYQSVQSKSQHEKSQPSVKEKSQQQKQEKKSVQTQVSKRRSKASAWVLTIGLIILGVALMFLCFILYEPSDAAYNLIYDQIFDGFKINFSAIKRTFDRGFETETEPFFAKMFGSFGMPGIVRGLLYAISWLIFLIVGIFWLFTIMIVPIGIFVLIRSLL